MSRTTSNGVKYVKYRSVSQALYAAGYGGTNFDDSSVLIWHDSIQDIDYFSKLQPWQIINRIPSMNVLCRKASFARIIQRISPYFSNLFTFLPKTYILPFKNAQFARAIMRNPDTKYIVKPDGGSLGLGIQMIRPGSCYIPDDTNAIGQKYVDSITLDNTKFDLRVYALVASITPLRIYVYRDGLARFCSKTVDDEDSVFSYLTNVTLNKHNDEADFEDISRLISYIFPRMKKEYDIDTDALWKRIEDVISLTIISSYSFIEHGEKWQCPNLGYPRCFQILGFDILLDKQFNPYVLEVNYRPSLDFHRPCERRMKVAMIRDAMKIGAAPASLLQNVIQSRKWGWTTDTWQEFLQSNPEILKSVERSRLAAEKTTNYHLVWSSDSNDNPIYSEVLEKVRSLPFESMPGFNIPKSCLKGSEA